jgi:hypothetical protein
MAAFDSAVLDIAFLGLLLLECGSPGHTEMTERRRHDTEDPLLDVTLRRNGLTRRWTITREDNNWSGRYSDHKFLSFTGCPTLASALAKKAEWEAEIEAAKADGWEVTSSHLPIG